MVGVPSSNGWCHSRGYRWCWQQHDDGRRASTARSATTNEPSNAGAFTDIVEGNNIPPGTVQVGYQAQAGWGAWTGWGNPIGAVLMQALQNALAAGRTWLARVVQSGDWA